MHLILYEMEKKVILWSPHLHFIQ